MLAQADLILDVAARHYNARLIRVKEFLQRFLFFFTEEEWDLMAHSNCLDYVDVATFPLGLDLRVGLCDFAPEVFLVLILQLVELLDLLLLTLGSRVYCVMDTSC